MLLHEYFEYYAREAPDHPCVEMEGQSLDYAAANRRTNRLAHAFLSAGLEKPDRISWSKKSRPGSPFPLPIP